MTWAGESGPTESGLYVFTDDGSPFGIAGTPGEVVIWENGVPRFMQQAAITGSAPLKLSQVQDVDVNGLTNGQVLKWSTASGAWIASSDIAGSGSVNAATPPTTDNAIVRWDGTTGDMIQNSNVIVDDNGNVSIPTGSFYRIDNNPLNIDNLADVSTSGINTPAVNEFLGWNGSQWVPQTPEGQGGPYCAITGAIDTLNTTSISPVPVNGMELTPPSGTYAVWFSTTASMNKNGQFVIAQIHVDGTVVQSSMRELGGQSNNRGNFNCQAIVNVNGSQTIDARWYITSSAGGGAGTIYERTLLILECDGEGQ